MPPVDWQETGTTGSVSLPSHAKPIPQLLPATVRDGPGPAPLNEQHPANSTRFTRTGERV